MAAPIKGAWLMLGGPQKLPIEPDQWQAYEGEPSFLLGQAYSELVQAQGPKASGKLLDLSMFSEPPLPYFVYKGREVVVSSPAAPAEMRGTTTVAGMPVELWDSAAKNSKLLPPALRVGAVVGYFYQVHHDYVGDLEQLEAFLEDATGTKRPPERNPRRRVVIFVQFPSALAGDNRRFARRRAAPAAAPPRGESVDDAVTVLDADSKVPAVYEWWFGPAPIQALVKSPPEGRWKRYHPQVCRRLEDRFQNDPGFRAGTDPVDVDGVRYLMQHITPDRPFDHLGKPSREPFKPENKVTTDHPCFSDMDRASQNCFVQFQKGNPQRRRPARRRPDASEIARGAVMTGNPCMICFSEDGQLTGCNRAHVICKGCLRAALRSMAGDTLTVDNLLCGCFGKKTRKALLALAELADVSLQELYFEPPKDALELGDFDAEVKQTRLQFDLGVAGELPEDLYRQKIRDWFAKVFVNDVGHLYHICSHPACADKMQNWILISDFETDYQARGLTVWTCPDGHRNSVLPSAEELKDINRNLLLHPEYYITDAYHDHCSLRRYRLCPECIEGGILMLAVHGEGCKQWPGGGRGHQHCFCFCCTRRWGTSCSHGSTDCADPGIQQVRIHNDTVMLGYVDGAAYLGWLTGQLAQPPPTVFSVGGNQPGAERQADLGLTDRARLLAESRQGTS